MMLRSLMGNKLAALVAVTKQIYNKRNLSVQFENLRLQRDSLHVSSAITTQDIKKSIIIAIHHHLWRSASA